MERSQLFRIKIAEVKYKLRKAYLKLMNWHIDELKTKAEKSMSKSLAEPQLH